MSTKDSLYMHDKKMKLCPLCEYSIYDAFHERGFKCTKKESSNFTTKFDLPVESITNCDFLIFAVNSCKKWVELLVKEEEAKAQTTLGDF